MGDHRRESIWNIYNAPVGSDEAGNGLNILLKCTKQPLYVGGDFNLRHPLWDMTNTSPSAACQDLIDWYSSLNLILLNPLNVSTHNRGGTIDLAFCTDENAKCEIRADLHTTSDHETLITTLQIQKLAKSMGKLRYKDLDKDLFLRLLSSCQASPSITSAAELELETTSLIHDIHIALTRACPRKRPKNSGTPWWNTECSTAHRDFCRARRSIGPSTDE